MRKLFLAILLWSLAVFLLAAVIFILPFDKRFGRAYVKEDCYDHAIWIYDRIHNNTAPADVVFLGSSRTIHAVNDKLLESMIDSGTKTTTHVLNLGYCRFGRNMEYENMLELLENKKPKTLVIEVREDEDRFSHIDYGYITDLSEVSGFVFYNPDYFKDIWKAFTIRLEYWKSRLGLIHTDTVPVQQATYGFGANDNVMDSVYAVQHIHTTVTKSTPDNNMRSLNYHFPEYYLKKIGSLAAQYKTRLFFLYLPGYSTLVGNPQEKELYQSLGTLLIPPSQIFTDRKNFTDENHLNSTGAKALCLWLSNQLVK